MRWLDVQMWLGGFLFALVLVIGGASAGFVLALLLSVALHLM